MPSLLDGLNEQQLQAVISNSSVILNLAGAGSGKTRVLTHRMAYLHQEKRVGTASMLALTFTRLAAKEMKERVMKLVGTSEGYKLTIGTFHSFCVRVLKEWGHLVKLEKNFTIYGEEDRRAIIQSCIEELGYKKVRIQDVIDYLYADAELPEDSPVAKITAEYYYRLARNNALDLDGLLIASRKVLTFPQAQMELQNRYRYVFVDEFQDTNDLQLEIIQLLNPENLFVVGDDFQAIYGWRGSNVQNIIEFPDKHPGCEVIKLERNYRSTKQIVTAANSLIKYNLSQTEKALIADRDGADIRYQVLPEEESEIKKVADLIFSETFTETETLKTWSDIAVLARTNRQLQKAKEIFDRYNIPSLIVSNQDDVFKKDDIRKIIALIEAAINPEDSINVRRVINFPDMRIGELVFSVLDYKSFESGESLLNVMRSSSITEAYDFCELLDSIRAYIEEEDTADKLLQRVLIRIGLKSNYYSKGLANRVDDLARMLEEVQRWCSIQDSLGESVSIYAFLRWLKTKETFKKS